MKRTHLFSTLAVVAAIAVGTGFIDAVKLRRTFTAGQKETFVSTMTMKLNADTPMGAQESEIVTESKTTIEYLSITDGKASYKSTTKLSKLDATGMAGQMMPSVDTLPALITTGKVDDRNRTTDVKMEGGANNTMMQMMTGGFDPGRLVMFLQLPEEALADGATFDVIVPKGPSLFPEDQKLKATFVGTQKVGDKSMWVVKMSGSLKTQPDMKAMAGAGGNGGGGRMGDVEMKMTGTTDVDSTLWFDPATGGLFKTEGKMKGKSNVEIVNMNMTFNLSLDSSFKIELKN